jgi:peptide/nickel transport system substrate-binding protein
MRIGIGLPPKGTPGTGPNAIVKLLMKDPWLTNRTDGRQSERVATGWTWDEAGTTLRLKLRPDVYFHDGTLLTPQIAAEALQRSAGLVKTPDGSAMDAFSFSSITAIVPAGPDTVEIRLKERNTFILPDLSGVFVTKPDQPDIGTGPFLLFYIIEV